MAIPWNIYISFRCKIWELVREQPPIICQITPSVINSKRTTWLGSHSDWTRTGLLSVIIQHVPDTLRWRHNGHDGVSNHQPHHCLVNRLFGCRSKKISKLRVTGLCAGNSPGTGEFPAQMASNAENVSIWWRHHEIRTGGWPNVGAVIPKLGQRATPIANWRLSRPVIRVRWHQQIPTWPSVNITMNKIDI